MSPLSRNPRDATIQLRDIQRWGRCQGSLRGRSHGRHVHRPSLDRWLALTGISFGWVLLCPPVRGPGGPLRGCGLVRSRQPLGVRPIQPLGVQPLGVTAARGPAARGPAARGQTDLEVFVEKLLNRSDLEPRSSGKVRWTICKLIPFAKRRLSGHESGSSVLPMAERHEEP